MEEDVQIAVEGGGTIAGKLRRVQDGLAAVIVVRRQPSDQVVADALCRHGFTTLTVDLLTRREALLDKITGRMRSRVPVLARRISAVAGWLRNDRRTESLPVACFAHGIGAAAALVEAAEANATVMGVVACDVREDLVRGVLARVRVPVLFMASEREPHMVESTQAAFDAVAGPADVVLIPASTATDECGAPETVARATRRWLEHHRPERDRSSPRPVASPRPA